MADRRRSRHMLRHALSPLPRLALPRPSLEARESEAMPSFSGDIIYRLHMAASSRCSVFPCLRALPESPRPPAARLLAVLVSGGGKLRHSYGLTNVARYTLYARK